MKFWTRYKKLSGWNKVGFWGAVASLVGLPFVFLPLFADKDSKSGQSMSNSPGSVQIGSVNAPIIIAGNVYQSPPAKQLPAAIKATAAANILTVAYTQEPKEPDSSSPHPAIRFGIDALRKGETQPWQLKNGDTLASVQDQYVVWAQPLTAGFLYVFQMDSTGHTQWLFPQNQTFSASSGENPVKFGSRIMVPAPDKGSFYLDNHIGIEHIYVVFSSQSWPQLENALATSGDTAAASSPIETPNELLTRGVGGTTTDDTLLKRIDLTPISQSYDGSTYEFPATGEPIQSSGAFLVAERWFKHVNPN